MLNLIIASTYLHKGSKKHPPPCGKHAKSQQLIFIRDENEDEDDDDDDDHDHGSHIHLHIESPPTWHSKIHNPSAIPGWSNVRVAPNMFKRIH